jgi:hypothetical protein
VLPQEFVATNFALAHCVLIASVLNQPNIGRIACRDGRQWSVAACFMALPVNTEDT